ncbi:MAG TPA: SDR family NAD(P)-dependent oxidoreductase, partial [Rhizomicrobium sp.]
MGKRLALVTGAGSGIGQAAAIALLEAGHLVACGYNANRKGAEAVRHADAWAVKIDIASRASVRRAIAACRKHFGRDIDVVVNNAALAQEIPFEAISDGDWDRMLAVNLRGAFIVAQEILPA